MMHKDLDPSDGIVRLYVSKKGGRGLIYIEDKVITSIRWLEN